MAHPIHKYTREVKSRNESSIITYVLISIRNRTDVKDVRIRRGAELYSEHYLLRAKLRMKSKRERKSIHIGGQKQKINTSIKSHNLGEKEIAKQFKERTKEKMEAWVNTAIDASTTTDELWKTLKDIVLSTAREICGTNIVGGYKKRTSWWNVSIKEQAKIKKHRWKEYLQKKQRRVI